MKTLSLVVVAVSLKQKAWSFAGNSPPQCSRRACLEPKRCEPNDLLSASSLLTSRRQGKASSRPVGSILKLRGGSGDEIGNAPTVRPSNNQLLALSSSSSSSSMQASSYYLIWSPGFVQKFAWASGSLWGMHMLQWDARLSKMMTQQWKALSATFPALLSNRIAATAAPNMILPLLSSSCCLIQLLINVLVGAGGCAGFNTVLGPVRPLFLAMLVSLNLFTGASLRQSLWRYSIALMPEGVHFWNELRKRQWRNRVESTANSADQSRIRATVMVDIPTMGCVACINKIESSLRACAPNNVLTASSWLEEDRKGGCAKLDVYVDSEDDLKALSQTVVDAIERAGFQDSVVTATEITSKT